MAFFLFLNAWTSFHSQQIPSGSACKVNLAGQLFLVTDCSACRRKCQDGADGGPAQQVPGSERDPRTPAVLLPPERQTAVQRKAEEEALRPFSQLD